MDFFSRLGLLNSQFIFQSLNFCNQSQFSVFERRLLISLLRNEMLDFSIFFSNNPLFSINLLQKKSDLSLMLLFQACCSFDMNITIFLLDIFNFSLIHFF